MSAGSHVIFYRQKRSGKGKVAIVSILLGRMEIDSKFVAVWNFINLLTTRNPIICEFMIFSPR